MTLIPSEGPLSAKLAIVGEKPAREEYRKGLPFQGPTGFELRTLLKKIGILPEQIYLTNAVKTIDDDLASKDQFPNPTREDIIREQPALLTELARLPHLNCIVALGGAALASLSNFHYDRILSRRGSILQSVIGKKMVPTFHPSFYLRTHDLKLRNILRFDLSRAVEQAFFPHLKLPSRTYKICETLSDVEFVCDEMKSGQYISFDIETRQQYISCIAFSKSPKVGYCIPLMYGNCKPYWSLEDEVKVWLLIQEILNQPKAIYVTQNGQYDTHVLWKHGIITPYMSGGLDTCYMQRTRAPGLPAKLEYIVSVHTEEPYYKDESGRWDEAPADDIQFWIYNIKDSVTTLEAAIDMRSEMQEYRMLELYMDETQALWPVVSECRQIGIRVDRSRLSSVRELLVKEINEGVSKIADLIGWVPNTKSPKDFEKFLVQASIPFVRTKSGRPEMKKDSLHNYAYKAQGIYRDAIGHMLFVNSRRTLLSGFTNLSLDSNGFYHPTLNIAATVTGRLASEGSDEGGPQIQNIPKYMRQLFIPDKDDWEFTQGDQKQAEQMLVAWLAQDEQIISAFKEGVDVHRVRGCILFRAWTSRELPPSEMLSSIRTVCDSCEAKGESECNHSERYTSKQAGHAFNYKQGPRRYCLERRKEGLFVDESTAKQYQRLLVSNAVLFWQQSIKTSLEKNAWLTNPLGRRREFYGEINDDMIREALSWLCQSTVGQITNRAMVLLHKIFQSRPYPRPRIVTQTHDSILVSHPKDQRSFVLEAMEICFNRPMLIHGRELTIPIEYAHGPDWGHLKVSK